jgi:EpsI family protein
MSTVLDQRGRSDGTLARWRPWLALLAGLAFIYIPTYVGLSRGLWRDDAYAHGPIIVAVFAWLVWRNRAALLKDSGEPSPIAGGVLVALGLVLYVVGRSQSLTLFEVASHLPVIAGALLVMRGPAAVRRFAFPLLFLCFLVPLPGFILDTITTPLKNVVSIAVAGLLQVFGYPVERAGVVLTVGQYEMLVADACSGLNSLYSLFALSLLYVHMTGPQGALRGPGPQGALRGPGPSSRARYAVLLLSLIPIAIVANIVRVMVLVLVTYHAGPEAAQGWVHDAAGMAVFVVALVMLLGIDRLMGKGRGARREEQEVANLEQHHSTLAPRASGLASIFLLVAFTSALIVAHMLKPLPADTSAVNLEKMLPSAFGGWQLDSSVELVPPSPDVQANLDRIYDQTVSRAYVNAAGEQMMLTVAYGGDQSDALKAHRQEVCYSAQGFTIHDLRHGTMNAAGRDIPVTRLHAVRGARSEPVTYWLTMGDRVVLGRLERLKVQLASGLAGRLPDGMLVRVSSIGDDVPRAHAAQQSFVAAALAAMPASDAARLVGTR